MSIILTLGRSSPFKSPNVYIDLLNHEISRGRTRLHFGQTIFKVAVVLLVSPHRLTVFEIASFAYDSIDGGPEDIRNSIGVHIYALRRRLAPLNITLQSNYTMGYEAHVKE